MPWTKTVASRILSKMKMAIHTKHGDLSRTGSKESRGELDGRNCEKADFREVLHDVHSS